MSALDHDAVAEDRVGLRRRADRTLGLDKPSAIELLRGWSGRTDDPAFPDIAERLAYLPLALQLAGAQMRGGGHTGGEWLQNFDGIARLRMGKDTLARHDSMELCYGESFRMLTGKSQEFYKTLAIFRENNSIPRDVVLELWRHLSPGSLTVPDFEETLRDLRGMGLIEYTQQESGRRTIAVHDLLHEYTCKRFGSADDVAQLHGELLDAFNPGRAPWWEVPNDPDRYLYDNIAYHLVEARRTEDLFGLLLEIRWLQARLSDADVGSLVSDFRLALKSGPDKRGAPRSSWSAEPSSSRPACWPGPRASSGTSSTAA